MDSEEETGETLPENGNNSSVKSEQSDGDSMSGSVRGRRVTDPTPVIRAPPGNEQLDPELFSAWQSMGKVKSALRRAEHRLGEAESSRYNLAPSAECSVTSTHNPTSATASLENRLPLYRSHDHSDAERGALVDNHGRTNYMRSRTSNTAARKVSRYGDKYVDDVPMRDDSSSLKMSGNEYHSKSPKKVEFYGHGPDYKDVNTRSSSSRVSHLHETNAPSSYKSSYDHHVVPSVYDMNNMSHNTSELNTTDPRALRDTEIRFLNENHAGVGSSSAAARGHEGLRRSAGMSRLTQVKVTVPGTTMFSSSPFLGSSSFTYTTSGRTNTVSTSSLFSRPDYNNKHAPPVSGQTNPPSSFSGPGAATGSSLSASALPAASSSLSSLSSMSSATKAPPGASGSNYKHAYGHADFMPGFNSHTVATRSTNNAPITTVANTSTETVNTTSSGFATVRKLRKSFNESDGFSKLKEKLKQQRMNLSNKVEERLEDASADPAMARHTQHHHDEVVVPKSYAAYNDDKPITTPKVRKVAAAPPPPSYKGFSEPETRIRPAEGKVFKLSELMRRKTRRKEASERQDKKKEGQHGINSPEEAKKVPRVIAKKPSKYDKKDIITTRSWRTGQEAVLRELGPARVKKVTHSPPTKDTDHGAIRDAEVSEDEIENVPPKSAAAPVEKTTVNKTVTSQSQQGAAAVKGQVKDIPHEASTTKALSAEAKSVLADLISDNSDSEDDGTCEKKATTKRKILKPSEPEKQQPAAKIRHYDSDEVRRYIAKQRAERKRKLMEEKESQRKANESKHRQLQELYKRQKETARVPPPHTMPAEGSEGHYQGDKVNLDSTFTRDEKEAVYERRADVDAERDESKQWSDTSSETSTLTGDSMSQPPDTEPGQEHKKSNKKSKLDLLDTPLNVDDIISKYTKAVAARKESDREQGMMRQTQQHATSHKSGADKRSDTDGQYKPLVASGHLPAEFGGRSVMSSLPPSDLNLAATGRPFTAPVISGASNSTRSRAERLAAITNTAASLRNRLRIETERINKNRDVPPKNRGTPLSVDDDRWAFRRSGYEQPSMDNSLDFVPRHERLGGAKEDYTVFKSNLPGVGSLSERVGQVEEQRRQDAAATCIQAVYRGHTVRQGLGVSVKSDGDTQRRTDTKHQTSGLLDETEESEGLSDITLTEDDSDAETPKIGRRLRDTDFHSEPRRELDDRASTPKGYGGFLSTKSKYSWNDPAGDPYSVINIYTRQYERDRAAQGHASGAPSSGGPKSSTPGQDKVGSREHVESGASPDVHHSTVELSQSESPILSTSSYIREGATEASMAEPSYEDDFTGSSMRTPQRKTTSEQQKSDKPLRVTGELKPLKTSMKSEDELSNDDDTLEGSYGYSLESDEEGKKQLALSNQKSHESAAESDLSSLGDDLSRRDQIKSSSRGSAKGSLPLPTSRGYNVHAGPRLSPAALSHRMTAELNLLEGMEESVRQLTDTERTRAVALSQQETVSLAQILKARQQEHERSMQALQMKARQESLDASKQLENARRRAADAAQNAVDLIAQVRSEGSASIQGSTKKLIDSQTEVARATAQAAKQLAQAKVASHNAGLGAHEVTKIATETATAAATAAVTAAMKQVAGLKNYDTHSTQVSKRSEYSRTDSRVSKTDASYDSESFDSSSYTPPQSHAKNRSRGEPRTESVRSSLDQSKRSAVTLRTASVATASDVSRRGRVANDSDSSIKTDPEAAAGDASRTESIPDEVSSSVDDYSLTFEATEDELEEQSFREILPSLVHMKKVKKEGSFSDLSTYSSDHEYVPPAHGQTTHAGRVSKHEDINSPFHGKEDSFTRFTADMVKQYMKEEEIRAQHQAALLQLREKALKEKTKAELAWLEQQKRHLRDKGADDSYPAIRKKKRGVLMRLQQEQMEIRRLQEAHKAEIKRLQEAHMKEHLDRRKELTYLTQGVSKTTQSYSQIRRWLLSAPFFVDDDLFREIVEVQKKAKPAKNACEPSTTEAAADETLSMHMSDAGEDQRSTHKSPSRDNKSDSEMYTENSDRGRTPSPSGDRMTKLQKMKLDKKFLTSRERRLRERRKNVEELLAWKKQLDEEEAQVYHMEEQALHVWDREAKPDTSTPAPPAATPKSAMPGKTAADKRPKRLEKAFQAEKMASKTPQDTPRDVSDSIMTETVVTARDESKTYQSIPEEISSQSRSTVRNQSTQHQRSGSESSINDEIKTESRLVSGKDYQRSGSESSLQEQSRSSSAASQVDKNRTHDSSDDTIVNSSVNEEYSNETFESTEATATATDNKKKVSSSSSPTKTNKLSKSLGQGLSPRSLRAARSPFSPANNRKGSESESEDSFSLTHSETASDQSDNEGRIRALTEELRRRKIEAERLKKEQKRRHKERMKAKEASLKKQIEAYEILISQVKTDLQKELEHEPVKPGMKPQIKQPRVSESKRLKKQEATTTPEAGTKHRTESESSKSSLSSIDESKDMTGSPTSSINSSSQMSPQSPDSSRHSLSPLRPDALISSNKRTSLESISESTESPQASPSKPDHIKNKTPSSTSPQHNKSNKDGATSPSKAQSNISISEVIDESIAEDLPDDISASLSEPIVKSARSLTFKLNEPNKADNVYEQNLAQPTENVDDVSVSEVDDYSYSFSVASRTDDLTTPRAKSVSISKHVSLSDDVEQSKSKTADRQEKMPLSARSAKSITSEIITEDFESASESEGLSKSRKSDRLTRSYSEKVDYTEDFSESSISQSEKTLSRRSDKDVSVDESIHTDEEISEALSIKSDLEEKAVELTFDLNVKLPESSVDDTPVRSIAVEDKPEPPLQQFKIGDRVLVGGVQPCTLRFVGETSFAAGFWAGVELDIPEGRNDGSKDGIVYFKCKPKYGLFAPPDKITALPKDFKRETEPDNVDDLSDASEHTLTDQDKSQMSDVLSDHLDVHSKQSAPKSAVKPDLTNQKEEEEDLDDVSVATDNSLMNVISSAAAAVESFDDSSEADVIPPTMPTSPKKRNLDAIVDNITDRLTNMVVKDTMKVASHISERQADRRVNSDLPSSPIKQNGIGTSENIKLTNGDDSHLLDMFSTNDKVELATMNKKSPPKTSDKAASSMTQNLLDDAISHMLTLRKRQREKVSQKATSAPGSHQQDDHHTIASSSPDLSTMSTPPASPVDQMVPLTPFTPEDSKQQPLVGQREAEELADDVFKNRVLLEPSKQDSEAQPPRPVSPVPGGEANKDFFSNEQFSAVNLIETDDIFADQEWIDDDFWTNRDGEAFNDLKETNNNADGQNSALLTGNARTEMKLGLQKLTQELFYAVPHKREEVQSLVFSTVDFFWQRRRYGESWENLTPPAEFFTPEDKGHDIESNSRKVYKRLVFDLTGEILREIYKDEEEAEVPSWAKKKFKGNRFFKEKTPPTTAERLKEVVENHVLNIMGLNGSSRGDNASNKFRCRKKRDPVDDILVQELREEEPEWVNYDDDELAVKMQVADSIFDSLVIETATICNDIYKKRSAKNESSTEI